MNLKTIKSKLIQLEKNAFGWRTNRKIVVFESDDWGSIRMSSKKVYDILLEAGIRVDKCPYNTYDSLASEEDLSMLFNLLLSFRDSAGNHPVFTANSVVANPDFLKIKESNYKEYHYELFTETLKRYPGCENSFDLWKQGINQKVFHPQFHGREHLNITRWLKYLQEGSKETLLAFDHSLFGLSTNITTEKRKSYMAALDFDNIEELEFQKNMLVDGLNRFETLFGYRSASFIAPNGTWHTQLEEALSNQGVKYLQGSSGHKEPGINGKRVLRHNLGSSNSYGQIYLVRNVGFEPSSDSNKDWVKSSLQDVSMAFTFRKPAVFSTHRVNYMGCLDPNNRKTNLKKLELLLKEIIKRWPDVEFMTTDQLGDLIRKEKGLEWREK